MKSEKQRAKSEERRAKRQILYGSRQAYLDEILQAGFDGVFLDVMDAWQTFR